MAKTAAIDALRKFTPCDIGDALVKLKYPNGGFLDGLKMLSQGSKGQAFGPAITVQMVELSDKTSPTPDQHFVDYNQSGSIMYIQQPKGLQSACWGGLMSTRAKYLGAQGAIVDGRIRDVSEHKEMGFPVFSGGTSILGSNSFTRASRINVPLQFKGDLWVNPGDILVGDVDGVVVTPQSLVEQVVALCEERFEIDQKTLAELKKGAEMGPLIKRLRDTRKDHAVRTGTNDTAAIALSQAGKTGRLTAARMVRDKIYLLVVRARIEEYGTRATRAVRTGLIVASKT